MTKQNQSLLVNMAKKYQLEPTKFHNTIMETVMPSNGRTKVTESHVASFLIVANKYDLNPFTKEIYAYPAKSGGIQPIVSIDGWIKMVTSSDSFDGVRFKNKYDEEDKLISVICTMHKKGCNHPIEVEEKLSECERPTEPWKKMPSRMLRHKAYIQAARLAFGLKTDMDQDEFERKQEMDITASATIETCSNSSEKISDTLRHIEKEAEEEKRGIYLQYAFVL